MELLKYFASALTHPTHFHMGFQKMSMGIFLRERSFRYAWQSHLQSSKLAQKKWVQGVDKTSSDTLIVLGAGRLFDCDLESLTEIFSKLILVDADTLCNSAWSSKSRKFPNTKFYFENVELTGTLLQWSRSLKKFLKENDSLAETLTFLNGEIPKISHDEHPIVGISKNYSAHAILSLNLLGQLPVMWQDIVFSLLKKKFGIKASAKNEEIILNSLLESSALLIRSHLQALAASKAENILLICDVEYFYYHAGLANAQKLPFDWQLIQNEAAFGYGKIIYSGEKASSTIEIQAMDALFGVPLTSKKFLTSQFPDYSATLLGTWLWNINPKAEDNSTQAAAHRVVAISFSKENKY